MRTLLLLLFFTPLLFATSPKDMESFQKVWETVRDQHWDLESTGVDWQAVYERYKPKIEQADTRSAWRKAITDMLGELGQSHFRILGGESQEALEDLLSAFPRGMGKTGFEVSIVDDRVFIVNVREDTAAAAANLAIGDEVLSLRGEDLAPTIPKLKKAFANHNHSEKYVIDTLNSFFSGWVGDELPVTVLKNGEAQELKLELKKPKGEYKPLLNVPQVHYRYESKILAGDIGYITFNIFTLDTRRDFEADMLGKLKNTKGLIIDIRGNPGGMGLVSVALAGRLVSERGKRLGQMTNQGGTLNFAIFPQKPVYTAPVAILVDAGSASTSEIFAAGLQDLERAHVFGLPSAGAALPSLIVDLPNGDAFQYAIADYVSVGGDRLEGVGVIPDTPTPHTLESLARGEDAFLVAALKWIKQTGAVNESL